jgi:hypothetical protein
MVFSSVQTRRDLDARSLIAICNIQVLIVRRPEFVYIGRSPNEVLSVPNRSHYLSDYLDIYIVLFIREILRWMFNGIFLLGDIIWWRFTYRGLRDRAKASLWQMQRPIKHKSQKINKQFLNDILFENFYHETTGSGITVLKIAFSLWLSPTFTSTHTQKKFWDKSRPENIPPSLAVSMQS